VLPQVVLDWDGTVTEVDGLHLVLLEFGDAGIYHAVEERLGRELTLHEVIALEFETVRASLDEVAAWVRENVSVRPGFARFARAFRPLVVSSGFHELIDPVLEREGVELDVRANQVDPRPEGWRALFRNEEPCPVCGEPCKRADVVDLDPFVFVGDGFSDRCVSLVANRVFARDGLARHLDELGHPFEPFVDFDVLASALAGAPHAAHLPPAAAARRPRASGDRRG
jgi:2-hydroxy-3-keto-5-methylthiopentenyl-1-phosphate phosphatase